jgi:Zn-dependent protease with chaperone function
MSMFGRVSVAFVALVLVLACPARSAAQAGSDRDQEKEQAIVAHLAVIAPQAVADFKAATAALDASDDTTALAGFERVLAIVPDFDPALRRSGVLLVQAGRRDEGLGRLERALAVTRSPENLTSLAIGLTFKAEGEDLPPLADRERARDLAQEAATLDPSDSYPYLMLASIALELDDVESFRRAVGQLQAHGADPVATHYFAAVLAAIDEDWTLAESEIREAGRLGLPDDVVKTFLAAGVGSRASAWRWAHYAIIATGVWIVGLLVLFVAGRLLSTATLRSVTHDDPNAEVAGGTRRLRSFYRVVVTMAGLYWYLSLPFVALIVIGLTGSVFYGFATIGRIPVKLVAMLGIGAVVSVWAIVRSLFVRVSDEDPGDAVSPADAPGLWQLVRDVAAEVGTRPVDEIWLTPGTEVAVYERGGLRARLRDSARRALILGAGVLDGFDQNALRAVLAHEYGHFSHRDTAGGDVALRVRRGMFRFVVALAQSGYAVWWNLAFQFVRLYDLLYRRISHGAIRLQEVLADRVAIQRYGLDAFRDGLTHVIRRSIEFDAIANREFSAAAEAERPIANIYELDLPDDPQYRAEIQQLIDRALSAETTADDTHPSPKDRFRLGERIHGAASPASRGAAWQLFGDAAAIKTRLHDAILLRISASRAVARS